MRVIKKNWPQVKLGDICELRYGKSLPEAKRNGGQVPVYGSNGLVGYHDDGITDGPTIIVGRKGSLGEVAYCPTKCWPIDTTYYIDSSATDADIAWLAYCMRQLRLTEMNRAAAVPGLNRDDAYARTLLLPPIEEQKRITAILDKADAIRRKRAETIRLADDFLRSAFLDMFGNPVTNPKRWQMDLFGKVGELDRGRSRNRPRNAPELLGGPYPLIQTGDISSSGGYIRSYTQTYSEIGLAQSKMWPAGTLCITIAANIARTAILTIEACFPDSVVGFKPNGRVRTEYIQYWLSFLQKTLEEIAPESAQKNINLEILRNLEVPIPPINFQDAFVRLVEKAELSKDNMRDSAQAHDDLFNSLVQRAFRGEL